MALDTLDFTVMIAIAVAMIAYFAKNKIFGGDGTSAGFTASVGGETSRNLVETLQKNGKNTIVFFGSQTGTAEDYASKLAKELSSKFNLKVLIADLADYDYENFADVGDDILVFFLAATYGEGEPTDNAVDFFEFIDNEADNLSSLRYSVFGLGNSTYEFYNAMGKKINTRLEELGAERFAEYGEGDDGNGTMDEDFLAWKDSVFESLKNNLNFEEHEAVYQPNIELTEIEEMPLDDPHVSNGEPSKAYVTKANTDLTRGPFDHSHPYISKITHTKELFESKDRSCVHAEFDLSNTNLRYSTGDHIAIWPSNANENVDYFIKAFGLENKVDVVFELKALDTTITIPFYTPITYSAVIRHHLEISGSISRQFLSSIAQFAPDEETKKRTLEISGDKALFAEKIHDNYFNIANALLYLSNGQPWSNVPFEFLIESVPHLQSRYYSISSSSLSEKTNVHITAVVEAEKHGDQLVTGVVTNLLKDIEINQNKSSEKPIVTYDLNGPRKLFSNYKLPVHIRRSTFKLPSNPNTPVILIGPGTGIAPMRGFVRERVALKKNNDAKVGKTLLFYGCRNENEDFLYKNEWPEYAKVLGESFEFEVAFSRANPAKKVYVQQKLLERSQQINKLLEDGAYIYVCGDASKMARDVQNTLSNIISAERSVSEERGHEIIRSYKVQNRYQEDVW
ncbi:hypothetical protein HYPBUDRAFT_155018 [Hyphopichia burtonii NRRL Y-1933]|uniref:NADPH--cytochrome P450 reductase n=1 Tax=Hyphopichia burtonii NRRL Y-1933 TaxID=984485 RepID=A0A1E4RS08_9ASCO|nr:hypothetical protein HYPBUDRAFT_155018 [Hyphopichia burtonii NRRL Y-1933]ODV70052.1 hypothetical protein HYPBUDRAFT_155018 [Hyphopichia burtonii NRRL Y-1933]